MSSKNKVVRGGSFSFALASAEMPEYSLQPQWASERGNSQTTLSSGCGVNPVNAGKKAIITGSLPSVKVRRTTNR